jgi:hypothetical protein
MSVGKRRSFAITTILGAAWAIIAAASGVSAQALPNNEPLGSDQVVAQMVAHNRERARALEAYRSRRHYHLDYSGVFGARQADMVVEVLYHSPGEKEFAVISESGSKWICNHVLRRLMQVEQENARAGTRERTEINPENYSFHLSGVESATGGSTYYVLQAEPRTENSYLFRGKVWVEGRDFAVARIEGEPAKNPSRWTKQSDFRHEYQCLDGFWLPARNDTVTQLHLLGQSHLIIEYMDYNLTRAEDSGQESSGQSSLQMKVETRETSKEVLR